MADKPSKLLEEFLGMKKLVMLVPDAGWGQCKLGKDTLDFNLKFDIVNNDAAREMLRFTFKRTYNIPKNILSKVMKSKRATVTKVAYGLFKKRFQSVLQTEVTRFCNGPPQREHAKSVHLIAGLLKATNFDGDKNKEIADIMDARKAALKKESKSNTPNFTKMIDKLVMDCLKTAIMTAVKTKTDWLDTAIKVLGIGVVVIVIGLSIAAAIVAPPVGAAAIVLTAGFGAMYLIDLLKKGYDFYQQQMKAHRSLLTQYRADMNDSYKAIVKARNGLRDMTESHAMLGKEIDKLTKQMQSKKKEMATEKGIAQKEKLEKAIEKLEGDIKFMKDMKPAQVSKAQLDKLNAFLAEYEKFAKISTDTQRKLFDTGHETAFNGFAIASRIASIVQAARP